MAFTDRFIKVPIKIYDRKQYELTNKADYEDSWMKINPFEISTYKPTQDKEIDNCECTYVSMKDGSGFYVYLKTDEFEALLNKQSPP